jgi:choline dehydrogenase-like flavoprotein
MAEPDRPDVIVIGSGPAGVSVTWPMVKAGLKVVMVDAGSGDAPFSNLPAGDIGQFRRDPSSWRARYGDDLSLIAITGDYSPKLMTPLARALMGEFANSNGLITKNFTAIGGLGSGGLSNIWGALVTIFEDSELDDYPINRQDLLPSYAAVIERIGISNGGALAGVRVEEGPPMVRAAEKVLTRHRKLPVSFDFTLERASNAVLMTARDGREACSQCGLCLWGCHAKSIYNSSFELAALRRFGNFDFQPGLRVRRLRMEGAFHAVDAEVAEMTRTLSAPRIILAAGTIASTSLAVRRLGLHGHAIRILTNPAAAMTFIIPELFASPLPNRSFSLGQLTYQMPLASGGSLFGVIYGADTLSLDILANRLPLSRPVALRLSRSLAPALLLATCYLPGRFSANRLYASGPDHAPRIVIDGSHSRETRRTIVDAGKRLRSRMLHRGAIALPGSLTLLAPGADGHYAGTFPMGGKGPFGCSVDGELNCCEGIHVVDGAALTSLPAKHCTLTIMANADRIGRGIAERLGGAQRR